MIGSEAGLGYVIMNSMATFKIATLVAAFIAAAIPAILLARIIAAIEVRFSA
jgi:ABC-type nitrate/sulfonate/bicarbonate transport system permease component